MALLGRQLRTKSLKEGSPQSPLSFHLLSAEELHSGCTNTYLTTSSNLISGLNLSARSGTASTMADILTQLQTCLDQVSLPTKSLHLPV